MSATTDVKKEPVLDGSLINYAAIF